MPERVSVDLLTLELSKTKEGLYIAPERRKLASGRMSCFYLNIGDRVMSYPYLKSMTVTALTETYLKADVEGRSDRIIGVPEGMHNLTSSVGDRLYIGQLKVREHHTDHGDQKSIEGEYEPGMTVGVFEDVMSTGGSTITRAIEPVKAAGLTPNLVIALVDRQYGGIPKLRNELHIPTFAYTNTRELVESLLRQDIPSIAQIKLLEQELAELTSA